MTTELDFDGLMDEVLREAANPAVPRGLEERIFTTIAKDHRETTMSVTVGLTGGLEETSVWASLWSGVRDLVLPQRLPELVLESRPVAVRSAWEQMRGGGGSRGTWGAVVAHGLVIALIGLVAAQHIGLKKAGQEVDVMQLDSLTVPLPPRAKLAGGGGGQSGSAPAAKGELPKIAAEQIVPPTAQRVVQPRLAVEATVLAQADLKMASPDMPNFGMPNSPLVGSSLGNDSGGGIGEGAGNGMGYGAGGNVGGGVYRVGGGVSAPQILVQPEPEFSDEARKAKFTGNVLVGLVVDERGLPRNVHIVQGVGMGLDEKALAAVRQYRFKPAVKDGRPVAVEMNVDVSFQIF